MIAACWVTRPSNAAKSWRLRPASATASGRRIASLNGVTCSTSWLWKVVIMLVNWAMNIEMPTEEPMLRISVHSAAPSVRIAAGSVAKAMVLSGTKTKPRPTPCATPLMAMVARGDVGVPPDHRPKARSVASVEPEEDQDARVVLAEQAADDHHREERADAAHAQEIAAGQHGIAEQVLDERRHQRHRRQAG